MDSIDYKEVVRQQLRASKRLGQNFLVNRKVAKTEAGFGIGKNVLEMGPGLGILTQELCKSAKRVLAVEKDTRLYGYLKENARHRNLELLNADFFDVSNEKLSGYDIMIANIPYNLSSKTLMWLVEKNIPAVLCLQKEFVDHMLAPPDTRSYSKLSVISALQFRITNIIDVPANDFYPEPKVSSAVVLVKPNPERLSNEEAIAIGLIMNHKKKKIANAITDSSKHLGLSKEQARLLAEAIPHSDMRPFKMQPKDILEAARIVLKRCKVAAIS